MKITIGYNNFGNEFTDDLKSAFPEIIFDLADSEDECRKSIVDADVFFGWPSRETFRSAKKLKWVHCPGTGIDRFADIPELIASDVVVTNARGPHTEPMADHVFAFILDLAHLMRVQYEEQKAHMWDAKKYRGQIQDLNGTTMGILSLGGIGIAVARRARAFGMKIYAVDINPVQTPDGVEDVWGLDRLDELIRISDWFVVTSPITPDTRQLIDSRRVGLFKPTAHLIIISRGGIVDEAAMTDALVCGKIAGAGIDAFDVEPLDNDSPLWDMPNVIISPHVSAESKGMLEGRKQIFKDNLRRYINGDTLEYICDKEAGY